MCTDSLPHEKTIPYHKMNDNKHGQQCQWMLEASRLLAKKIESVA